MTIQPDAAPRRARPSPSQQAEPSVLKRERRAMIDALCHVANLAIKADDAADAADNERDDQQLFSRHLPDLADFECEPLAGCGKSG